MQIYQLDFQGEKIIRDWEIKSLVKIQFAIHNLFGFKLPWRHTNLDEERTHVGEILDLANMDHQFAPRVTIRLISKVILNLTQVSKLASHRGE